MSEIINEQPDTSFSEEPNNLKPKEPKTIKRLHTNWLRIPSRVRALIAVLLFAAVGSLVLFITNASPTNVANPANFSAEGELKRYILDNFAKINEGKEGSQREEFFLKTNNGDQVKLNLPKEAQKKLRGGSKVRISGNKAGDTVTVPQNYAASVQVLEPPSSQTDLTASTTDTPAATNRKVAVILLNFTDDTSQPSSVDVTRQTVFTLPNYSSNSFFKRNSYNQLGLTGHTNVDGDIFGYYTIPAAKAGNCDYLSWGKLADQAAQATGADLSVYNHVIYAFPQAPCPFNGIADLPGNRVWLSNGMSPHVISHELGHNLGLYHSNGFKCKNKYGFAAALSEYCTNLEYFDYHDTMGSPLHNNDDFNGYYKRRLGWLSSSNTQTVTTSGDYTLTAFEAAGPEVKELKIPNYINDISGNTSFLQVEYRQRSGEGVLVRFNDETFGRSYLLDTTEETGFTSMFHDAPLAIGRTFTNAANTITITPISSTSSSVKVRITITPTTTTKGKQRTPAPTPPPNNAQLVSSTVPTGIKPGEVFNASITMKNTGTTTWLATDYQLGAIVIPANKWGKTRLTLSRDVAPGATAVFTGTFIAPDAAGFGVALQSFSWRMLKNSTDDWFGGALLKAVSVSSDLTIAPAPTNLKTTAVTTSTVSLSWAASTAPNVQNNIERYHVYRVASGGELYLAGVTSSSAPVFTDELGLSPSTTYTYYVVAVTRNGLESPQSVPINVTTAAVTTKPRR